MIPICARDAWLRNPCSQEERKTERRIDRKEKDPPTIV